MIIQDGITPLMGASQNGHIEVIKILVVHHANVDARDLVRPKSLL
jgi:ankyrin repeat protein